MEHDIPADPLEQARELERVHAAVLSGGRAPREPRPVVAESWRRSLRARVDPERRLPPLVFDTDRIGDVREAHPLAVWVPLVSRSLLEAADASSQIVIVTDAEGTILWRQGDPGVCRDADRVLLAEGTQWAEHAIGTNAMGTTLATGAPVRIHSAEHLVRTYHAWTCAACPVRDPDTGRLLGSIDLSGPLRTMHPALMALVTTSAQLVESELRRRMDRRDEALRERNGHHLARLGGPGALVTPTGRVVAGGIPDQRVAVDDGVARLADGRLADAEPLPDGYLLRLRSGAPRRAPRLRLRLLDERPTAAVNGVEREISLRHAEILALLAMHPRGLTADRLALLLHGEHGNPTTVRVEIHRIRHVLGESVVRTRPYRIAAEVDSDVDALRAAVRRGDPDAVLDHARALLPRSESPAIRAEREELLAALRAVLLREADPERLWRFANTDVGREDPEVLEELREALPAGSPERTAVDTRLRRLLAEEA
ncbi:helix-turn-helix domain-containing protein [Saccharopolyspora rosea]|uniref:GAF domain-containing protein n=1 Tax=Saccharopolyspora rosea TaxID=524884 RepID=A0ABW3G159_9PSEU|nr:GAF domain-containing protein [Saccharopolyspora rosea]